MYRCTDRRKCVCVCRYCPSTSGATSVNGTTGCSLYFLGRLYDGASSKRRGVSSLSLPKPKLHLTLNEPVSRSLCSSTYVDEAFAVIQKIEYFSQL